MVSNICMTKLKNVLILKGFCSCCIDYMTMSDKCYRHVCCVLYILYLGAYGNITKLLLLHWNSNFHRLVLSLVTTLCHAAYNPFKHINQQHIILNLLTINSQYREQIHFAPKYSVRLPFTHMLQDCKARSYRTGDLWYPGDRKESLSAHIGTQSPVTHSRCGP